VHAHSQPNLDNPQERDLALKATIEDAVIRLSSQLAKGHTKEFEEVLTFYNRFWTYSVRNSLLIQLQCPGAVRCAGRVLWNQMGYHIKKGEKAIWIWAPVTRKQTDPDTGELFTVIAGFRPAPVFDFSQMVEAEDRPLLSLVPRLPDDMQSELTRCIRKVEAAGIRVEIKPTYGTTLGVSRRGVITISSQLDSRNQIFVLLHELVHELYHQQDRIPDPTRTREQAEFEAESVAYVAASVMGLEHPGARDYLLHWEATPKALQRSLITIQSMVKRIVLLLEIPFDVPNTPEALIA
jgi:predicted cupin superfamily sugar epimerase